jgi:hypothetical protein
LFATCGATRSTVSLSHASSNVAAMRAGDEETSVKLVQAVENFVYLHDYCHEYYANTKKDAAWREISKKMDLSGRLILVNIISIM